jgi:hypothetical protein
MMTFIIGLIYFDNIKKLHELNKTMLILLLFSLGASAIGYIYGIGKYFDYDKSLDPQAIGLLGSSGLYSAAVTIGILPFIAKSLSKHFHRWLLYSSALIVYIFILLNVRRTAIMIPIIGLSTFVWFYQKKGKIVSLMIISLILLLILSPLYKDKLIERFKARQEQGRFEKDFYKTESRYTENIIVFSNAFSFKNPLRSIFGYEIYASGREKTAGNRMYHSDSANLLAGTGILGVFLYILIYIKLFKLTKCFKYSTIPQVNLLKSAYYSLLFISLFVSLNGSMTLVSLRSFIFLYLGAILSLILSTNRTLVAQKELQGS